MIQPGDNSRRQSMDSRQSAASRWTNLSAAAAAPKKGWDDYDKAEQVNATGCIGGEDEDPNKCGFIRKLKQDLANSYYWTGNFVRDYFFFVMQWHPLLGILMSHPNHPWTKMDRFWMFMISVGLTFVPSCAISKMTVGDPDAVVETTTTLLPGAALSGSVDVNVAILEGEEALKQGGSWLSLKALTLMFVTVPDVIIGVILYQLAIAETRCGSCPCCIPFGKCLMKNTLVFAFIICGINFGIGWSFLGGAPPIRALEVMAEGKVWSYLTWFIIWMLLPCQLGFISLWTYERKEEERQERLGRGVE